MSQKNIQDELRGLGISLPEAEMPYSVPEGYFDGLADAILTRIKSSSLSVKEELESLSPLLSGISKEMPFTIPENYFTSVTEDIPVLIHDDESSAILKYIDRSNPYEVPDGYFENFPTRILEKATGRTSKGAKVIPMMRRKWSRLAVAASIAVLAVSGIFYFNSSSNGSKDPIAQIKKASNQDLFEFLNTTDANLSNSATANLSNTEDAKHLLKDVPDNELNSFLNMEGADDLSSSVN
jgi:hypothetical protein